MKLKSFTKRQRDSIYNWIDRHDDDACAIFLDILASTGCRVDELMRIQRSSINRIERTITIERGSKGSASRTRRATDNLLNRIDRICDAANIGPHDLIRDLLSKASINCAKTVLRTYFCKLKSILFVGEKVAGLHGFRHCKAQDVYEATGNVYMVKTALGHKSIASTECYLAAIDENKNMDLFSGR
jgi:integrase